MNRPEVIAGLIGATAMWPRMARAQQGMPLLGFLGSGSPGLWAGRAHTFLEGLAQAGFVEGRDVSIRYRRADDDYGRLPALATELIRSGVALIAVAGPAGVL